MSTFSSSEKKRLPGLLRASCAGVLAAMTSQAALAQEAHVHGVSELNLAAVGQTLQAEFLSPAANLLGFEYSPVTVEELTAYAEVEEQLRSASWLFGSALDGCAMEVVALDFPEFAGGSDDHDHDHDDEHEHEHEEEHHDHDDDGHDHDHSDEGGGHADYRVEYSFDCSGPISNSLTLTAFESFSGIEEIVVQWVTASDQGFAELTPNNSTLSLQ